MHMLIIGRMAHNPLAGWLAARNIRPIDLARKLGVSPAQVSEWMHGKRRPGIDNAYAIEEATEGEVPVSAWRKGVVEQ